MLSARPNQRARHTLWVALGFLCCALIVCASILQVGHIHPDGQAVQSDCALCHTAHLVVQPSIPQSLPPHRAYRGGNIYASRSRSAPGTSLYFLSSPGLHLWTLLSLKATSNAKTQDLWRPLCQGRSRNLRTRHLLLGAARLLLLRTHYFRRDRAARAHARRTAKRSSPIARFATSPTWSFNQSVPQLLPRTVLVAARVSTALQPIRAQFFFVFSLFTRPPPVQTANS